MDSEKESRGLYRLRKRRRRRSALKARDTLARGVSPWVGSEKRAGALKERQKLRYVAPSVLVDLCCYPGASCSRCSKLAPGYRVLRLRRSFQSTNALVPIDEGAR